MYLSILIALIAEKNISLSAIGGQLITQYPPGKIPLNIKKNIERYQDDLLNWVETRESHLNGIPLYRFSKVLKREKIAVPATMMQQTLWHQHQQSFIKYIGNLHVQLPVSRKLDPLLMAACLNSLLARHRTLRTTFCKNEAGVLVQRIRSVFLVSVPLINVGKAGIDNANFDREVECIGRIHGQAEYNLEQGPLFRVALVQAQEEGPNEPGCQALLFSAHRSILDESALLILLDELLALYKGKIRSVPAVDGVDYALWEREWLSSEAYGLSLDYWRVALSKLPPALNLPYCRLRSRVTRSQGAWQKIVFSKVLSKKLKRFSDRGNTPLSVVLVAALKVLLMRYTGQRDIAIATKSPFRRNSPLQSLAANLDNFSVLRNDLGLEASFKTLVHNMSERLGEDLAHQPVAYSTLEKMVRGDRHVHSMPLCQVMFELNPTAALPNVLNAKSVSLGLAEFDLSLRLESIKERFEGHFEYNTDLLSQSTIEQFARHYLRLLASVIGAPDTALAHIPILTPTEEQGTVKDWNQTKVSFPRTQCVHELFEAQVEKTPKAMALSMGDEVLSYEQLNQRSNQLAWYLHARGVGPEVTVGLLIDHSIGRVIAIIGIIKAGGCCIPMASDDSAVHIAGVLESSGVEFVLTQSRRSERIRSFVHSGVLDVIEIIVLDAEWPLIACQKKQNFLCGVRPGNLIYTLYGTGSAGVSRGTMLTHENVVICVDWLKKMYGLDQSHKVLLHTAHGHDLSAFEILAALISGAQLNLMSQRTSKDAVSLARHVQNEDITTLFVVPSVLKALLDVWSEDNLPYLEQVISKSEALPVTLHNEFLSSYPNIQLSNLYGPTETTVFAASWACDDLLPGSIVPLGGPVSNVQIYILDRDLYPVPVGVVGELYIGGLTLARGYAESPALSAEYFLPDGFGGLEGSRLYKSRDLASFKTDGTIVFRGCVDHQVKNQGCRIELREIENVLLSHVRVREAVVAFDETLVAYLVLEKGARDDEEVFREMAEAVLPEYMRPSFFVFLDCLPMTSSGVLARGALGKVDASNQIENKERGFLNAVV